MYPGRLMQCTRSTVLGSLGSTNGEPLRLFTEYYVPLYTYRDISLLPFYYMSLSKDPVSLKTT